MGIFMIECIPPPPPLYLLNQTLLHMKLVNLTFRVGYMFHLHSSEKIVVNYQIC